jgi:hypothetical protein
MANQTLATILLDKYGALMSVEALAELLGSTPRRVSNGFANNLPWSRPFKRARIKIGRRVLLNTAMVAEILEERQGDEPRKQRTRVQQVCRQPGPRKRGDEFGLPRPSLIRSFCKINGLAATDRISHGRITGWRGTASQVVLSASPRC